MLEHFDWAITAMHELYLLKSELQILGVKQNKPPTENLRGDGNCMAYFACPPMKCCAALLHCQLTLIH